jgi:hypothetical protein
MAGEIIPEPRATSVGISTQLHPGPQLGPADPIDALGDDDLDMLPGADESRR